MASNSGIEWTDHTFNPWIGCTKVSPACDHCYAERQDHRFGGGHWGPGAPRKRTRSSNWNEPRKWDRQAEREGTRYRVFCASLADVFDNEIPEEWREGLWALIRETPNLDWLLLTKRAGNIEDMLPGDWGLTGWDNVWLGVTVVKQEEADRDIPKLLRIPAERRFVSVEPLLEPLDLRRYLDPWTCSNCCFHNSLEDACFDEDANEGDEEEEQRPECKTGNWKQDAGFKFRPSQYDRTLSMGYGLDWVIVGGESGPQARPMHPDWVRSLRDQCSDDVPFFFKQWGEWAPGGPDERFEEKAADVAYGEFHGLGDWVDFCMCREGTQGMTRLGKKAAGRELDGEAWSQMPTRETVHA